MKVVQGYNEHGRTFATVEIEKGETVGELKDKLKAIDEIVIKTISDTQGGYKTMKTETIREIIHPLDRDHINRIRQSSEKVSD